MIVFPPLINQTNLMKNPFRATQNPSFIQLTSCLFCCFFLHQRWCHFRSIPWELQEFNLRTSRWCCKISQFLQTYAEHQIACPDAATSRQIASRIIIWYSLELLTLIPVSEELPLYIICCEMRLEILSLSHTFFYIVIYYHNFSFRLIRNNFKFVLVFPLLLFLIH